MEVQTSGAASDADARAISKAVVASSLVKAAVYGHDPNWGRIACAAGWEPPSLFPIFKILTFNTQPHSSLHDLTRRAASRLPKADAWSASLCCRRDQLWGKQLPQCCLHERTIQPAECGAKAGALRGGLCCSYAGAPFDPNSLDIKLGDIALMEGGQPLQFDAKAASSYLKSTTEVHGTVYITMSVGEGSGSGTAWGCDLSYDYVKINAEYTT